MVMSMSGQIYIDNHPEKMQENKFAGMIVMRLIEDTKVTSALPKLQSN
jgi:hypothetical protein